MNKGGKQGEGREGSWSLCIFRSICASSGPELWALPHQMCLGFSSSKDTEPSPPERALSSSLCCVLTAEGVELSWKQQLGSRCPMEM